MRYLLQWQNPMSGEIERKIMDTRGDAEAYQASHEYLPITISEHESQEDMRDHIAACIEYENDALEHSGYYIRRDIEEA